MLKTKKTIRTNAAIMLVICVFAGLIFTFGPSYLFRAVSDENMTRIQAVFSSYEADYLGEGISIGVHLEDGRTYLIDDEYFSDALTEKLNALKDGTQITIDVQNQTDYILGMKTEKTTLIDHDETMRRIGKSLTLSRCAAALAYVLAALSFVTILFPKGIKKKRSGRRRK